jgi:hypothetical protein
MNIEELRDLSLSLTGIDLGNRILLSCKRQLEPRSTLAAGGPGTRSPSLVLLRSIALSNSATAPNICIIIRPAAVVVSIASVNDRNPAPASSTFFKMCKLQQYSPGKQPWISPGGRFISIAVNGLATNCERISPQRLFATHCNF